MYNRLKKLTIDQKFKIIEATKEYPLFSRDDINIDDEWCQRISDKITEEELNNILESK